MQLKHNISKLYILKALLWFMVSMPIIVVFFQERGNLSLTEVMILQSVYSFTIAITEIPSGYLADYFGRKNSIIVSTIFMFTGYLIFSNYTGFEVFMLAEILIAIGGSLMSGADSAIMYDTLIEINKKSEYTKIEGKTYAIGNFSEAIAGLLVTFLVTSSLLLPIQVQTCIIFLTIPLSITLVEPTINNNQKIEKGLRGIKKSIKISLIDNSNLRWYIIYSSIMGVASLSAAWLAQPFFNFLNIPIINFGILWASLNLIAGVGSYKSYKIEKKYNIISILTTISILLSVSFLFIYFNANYLGLILIYLIYYLRGIITPILKNQINLLTDSNIRATIMSIRSFILRISFSIIAPMLGFLADNQNLIYSFLSLSIIIIITSSISLINLNKIN